jgi:hypothetical protein
MICTKLYSDNRVLTVLPLRMFLHQQREEIRPQSYTPKKTPNRIKLRVSVQI